MGLRMFDLTINLAGLPCHVVVEAGVRRHIGERLRDVTSATRICVVTDDRVGPLYADGVRDSMTAVGFDVADHVVPAGEASKSVHEWNRLHERLAEIELARDGMILALGGGVVSDLAGFAAATWLRGVAFAICPTTLEADVDAAIGGKTGINLRAGKNLVGAFHQPRIVAVDPEFLTTLDARDVRAGLAESVKHGLVFSEAHLARHERDADAILRLDPAVLVALIRENIRIKAAVVEADAREQSDRRILLNFGHTIGHAIESCSDYGYRHGECVALGMLAACRISAERGIADEGLCDRLGALLTRLGLPSVLDKSPPPIEEILESIRRDKKVRSGRVRFVLLEGVGKPRICDDVSDGEIRAAYDSLIAG